MIELENDKQIYDREQEQGDRRHHAEEQIGYVWRLATITGLYQFQAGLFLADPFAEVEAFDDGLDVLFRRLSQFGFAVLIHPLAFAQTDFFALKRHCPHALVERIDKHEGHRKRQHGRRRRYGGEYHRQRLDVYDLNKGVNHRTLA